MADSYEITDEDLSAIQESEVDQVLAQAALESPDFIQFLTDQVFAANRGPVTLLEVITNVTMRGLGETDVQIRVRDVHGHSLGLLIENKVHAPAAPPIGGLPQDERYMLRGRRGQEESLWDDFRTCLCAPQKYLDAHMAESTYQQALPQELIQEWFESFRHPRAYEWASVMAISIESCRRGWVPILDDGVHRFSLDYWNYLQTHHPEIEMTKPTITAKGALWKYLGFPGVPGKNIVHKVHRADQNSMDLQKPSSMTNEVFRAMYEPLIAGLAELVDAGNSVVVRIPTPVIDPETPLRDQTAALEECLRVGYRLANLYRSAQQV